MWYVSMYIYEHLLIENVIEISHCVLLCCYVKRFKLMLDSAQFPEMIKFGL